MNQIYRLIWNATLNTWIVVPEITNARGKRSSNKQTQFLFALGGLLYGGCAFALDSGNLPSGGQITGGSGYISQTGNQMLIHQNTNRMSANWDSFNIGQNARVQFQQPSTSSVALNRVVGQDASDIQGKLDANGQVYLINPNGVVFGKTAQVSVGGLVASTQQISTADFNAGIARFSGDSTAKIENYGRINASNGVIALIANQVDNSGSLQAEKGDVVLAAGKKVSLDFDGDGLIQVEIDGNEVQAQVNNHGLVQADGAVVMTAKAAHELVNSVVNNDGIVKAQALQHKNGRILLEGDEISNRGELSVTAKNGQAEINLAATHRISHTDTASVIGKKTSITLDSGVNGGTQIDGLVSANNAKGKGGEITVLGKDIELQQYSQLQAKGKTGGGKVLVGGDWQGSGSLHQASTVKMAAGAKIDASAIKQGNGGRVVLWSDVRNADSLTTAQGSILANAGLSAGNGGQVETSGHHLDVNGLLIKTLASKGRVGLWLLDPYNYTIGSTEASTISTALAGSSVTVDTNSNVLAYGGSGNANNPGDITVNSAINKVAGVNTVLTMNATGNIVLNAGISSSSGQLKTVLNASTGSVGGVGNINTNGGLLTVNNATAGTLSGIISGSGGVTKSGAGNFSVSGANIYTGATSITAGTLQIGDGGASGSLGAGAITNSATLSFNRNNSLTLANAVSGTGSLIQSGTGTTVLTGANTYTGISTISAGSLQVGSGGTVGSLGTGAVTNNANLNFNRSNSLTVVNAISGTGTVTKNGAGTLVLTGANTYTGATTISTGILQVGSGRTVGSLGAGDISNNGNLTFSRSNSLTVANAISGTGTFTKSGTGTTVLTGANTYTGISTITAGSLQIGNGAASGSLGSGAVTNNANLTFNRSDNITVANAISGTGTVTKSGAGTVVLTGTNTYSGISTVSSGSLQVGDGGITGSLGTGAVTNNATLSFNRSNNLTFANAVSGTGSLIQSGTGTTVLTGANTYTGISTISAGTLQVGSGGTVGSLGTGAVTNNATLSFNRSNSLTVANVISGTGSIAKSGTGTTLLAGKNTYAGTTSINGGILQVGNGASGSLGSGAVTNNATLSFNRSNSLTVANTISGTGSLTKSGTGTVVLTGANTYTGISSVTAGSLQVGDGGTTGNLGAGAVTNNANLSFNRSDSIAVANAISGTGSVTQSGSGTLVLTGNNTYSGATNINTGILQVGDGSITGSLGTGAVTNNATLSFNRSNSLTVANAISGSGTVTQSGLGTTILTGANINSGATTISAGILQVGNGANGSLGTGDITNNANLTFNRSNSLTVANAISGTGTVTKSGTGTTILTGNNTFTGMSTITAGSLQVGNGAATGSLGTGTVTNNANLTFNRSDSLSVANAISGTGSLTKSGTGMVVLTGANTYTGISSITAGSLQVGDGGTTGNLGAGAVTNNANLSFNRSDSIAVANAISGTGSITQTGSGTLVLTGTNTYSGATSINTGILQVGDAGLTGSLGTGAVTNNATLSFNRSNSLTVANAISGIGTVIQSGLGTTILTGANTNTGATTISAGILQVGNGATGSLGTGVITNNANLTFNRSNNLTVANAISGTGTVTKSGAGTTILTGNNTYSGITTISAGILQVGDGGSTGSLGTGAVTNNANLTFDRSDSLSVANTITGTGTVTQSGDGTTVLTGANTYTGISTISAGALQVGDGTNTGSLGTGAVTNNANLTFNRSNSLTVANAISGSGSVTQGGTGTTVLTGANTYSGISTINAGTLQVGSAGTVGNLGSGAVTNNATLSFNRSNSLTVANAISGTGTLTQSGLGTTILTGANTYTGATTINSGILQIGNGATGSLGLGDVTNNANLSFNSSNSLSVANAISGIGTLTKNGTGTTLLTGANTYSGITTISAGILQVGDGGSTGSLGTGAVTNNANLTFDRSDSLSVANAITGTGTLTQTGDGTTVLTGTNTYTGISSISAGTLQVGDGGLSGSLGTGGVSNNATLSFNRSNSLTVANAISGTGRLTQNGTGTVVLTGANTFSGISSINAGSLQVGSAGTIGALGTGDISNNANLTFNRSNSLTIANAISGTGTLTKSGAGTLMLTGANTYTGMSTITAGILQVGDGGTTGSLGTGAITNNANLTFNRSDSLAVANAISGTGTVTQSGAGTSVLTGASTYSGITTISAGTLQIGDGGVFGTLGAGAVLNNGILNINRSGTLSLSSIVSHASGITGTGDVIATLGGGFNVDRVINLSGANSNITLKAGSNIAAGTANGGDVTLNNTITTSASGTVTVFSGNPNTAAISTFISGANGSIRYKTYNSSSAEVSGAVSGTRNFYYRSAPSATVSGVTATNKDYDGTAAVSFDASNASVVGGVDGDNLMFSSITGSFVDPNAGFGKAVNLNMTYNSGIASWVVSGYLTNQGLSADINPAGLTINGLGAVNKTYDGTAEVTISNWGSLSGLVAGETLGLIHADAYFSDKAAGTNKIVTATGYTLTDGTGLASNYHLVSNSATTYADINFKALSLSGIHANNKDYDGNRGTDIDTGNAVYTGLVNGDDVVVLATGEFTDKNAGIGKTVALTSIYSGADVNNYIITDQSGTLANINTKALSFSGISADNKTYDGTANAIISNWGNLSGLVAGETLVLNHADAYFSDKAAGTNKTVTATGYTITDGSGLASNYHLLSNSATTSADINTKALTLSGILANNKDYDGNRSASIDTSNAVYTGLVSGDELNVSATGEFTDKNAGTGKTVMLTSNYSGADANNYSITDQTSSTADINTKALMLSGIRANNKEYDGSRTADIDTGNAVYTGLVNGDEVIVSATGEFTDKNAGKAKTVALASHYSGADANNYNITDQTSCTADINAKALLLSGIRANNKDYDGNISASIDTGNAVYTGLVNGDEVMVSTTGEFTDKNAGIGKAVILSRNFSGNDAGNYRITGQTMATADIFVKTLTVLGATSVSKVYDGSATLSNTPLNVIGQLGNDQVLAFGSGILNTSHVGSNIGYHISDFSLNGADAANYKLNITNGLTGSDGSITARAITLTASAVSKVYDGHNQAFGTANISSGSLANGDSLAGVTVNFSDKNVGANKTVTITAADISGVAQAGDYQINYIGDHTSVITRLNSVTWTGAGDGSYWFDPANWGGAVPDLSNVANVILPYGVNVVFGNGPMTSPQNTAVNIDSLATAGNLMINGGILNIGNGGMMLNNFTQTDGVLSSNGNIQLANFSQTGGISSSNANFSVTNDFKQGLTGILRVNGITNITDTSGGIILGNLASNGALLVNSTGGDISQTNGSSVNATAGSRFTASNGSRPADILLSNNANNFVGAVTADAGKISVSDGVGGLQLGNITSTKGLTAISTDGGISQASGTWIRDQGVTTLSAGKKGQIAAIQLSSKSNDFTQVNATGKPVFIKDINGFGQGKVDLPGYPEPSTNSNPAANAVESIRNSIFDSLTKSADSPAANGSNASAGDGVVISPVSGSDTINSLLNENLIEINPLMPKDPKLK